MINIDAKKLVEAMSAADVTISKLVKVSKLSQSRISQLRNYGGNIGELAGEAICKTLKVKPEELRGEE